jgi:hypothetical protein
VYRTKSSKRVAASSQKRMKMSWVKRGRERRKEEKEK